jgi:hypothetical protein
MKKNLLLTVLCLFMATMAFTQKNLIKNGLFEIPDDGAKYYHIFDIPNWLDDDTTWNTMGRETSSTFSEISTGGYHYHAYACDTAGEIYQIVDTIPADKVMYICSLQEYLDWTPKSGDTINQIIAFSAFAKGADPSTRVKIDTFIAVPAYQTIDTVFDTLTLQAGSKWAGQVLTIGYYARNVNRHHTSDWVQIDSFTLTKTVTVGINSVNSDIVSLSVSPNPSKGLFNLTNVAPGTQVTVYDLDGKEVLSLTSQGNAVQLDLTNYKGGVYILRATGTDFNTVNKKLLIQ